MKRIRKYIWLAAAVFLLAGCSDDDSFSASRDNLLTFSVDTIRMDTVFSRVPSSRRSLWVYNNSGSGIRCSSVRLANGSRSGFRINVDGEYLGSESSYQATGVEVRDKDSIFVNIELTSLQNNKIGPQFMEDNLVFALESGVEQKVNLNAYSWDADIVRNLRIGNDTTISSERPIVVFGEMRIDSAATATIVPGTTLYFHAGAKLDVYGTLVANGTADQNIVFRGDRTDRMFDYLPYDMVSGQWNGIHFHGSSYNNVMSYTDTHSTFDGIVCDSSNIDKMKLSLYNSTVHNCQGYGLKTVNSTVDVKSCQLTNALNDCVAVYGGKVSLVGCTIAQFYPFDSNYGAALRFTNGFHDGTVNHDYPLRKMECVNSIVTGYDEDVVMGVVQDSAVAYTYKFVNSILRTDSLQSNDSIENIIWENADSLQIDTVSGGEKNFRLIDRNRQYFDFHLSSKSRAIGAASVDRKYALPLDRDGRKRDDEPDMGCYEYAGEAKEQ